MEIDLNMISNLFLCVFVPFHLIGCFIHMQTCFARMKESSLSSAASLFEKLVQRKWKRTKRCQRQWPQLETTTTRKRNKSQLFAAVARAWLTFRGCVNYILRFCFGYKYANIIIQRVFFSLKWQTDLQRRLPDALLDSMIFNLCFQTSVRYMRLTCTKRTKKTIALDSIQTVFIQSLRTAIELSMRHESDTITVYFSKMSNVARRMWSTEIFIILKRNKGKNQKD